MSLEGHPVVSREAWTAARLALLEEEKELTRLRDKLSQKRRELPWVLVEKEYTFTGSDGEQVTLGDAFGKQSQLLVYHFMFDPEWKDGCSSCSFWADNFNNIPVHLRHRDIALVTVSKAPIEKLNAFKERLGWSFPWLSSHGSDFNADFGVSFTKEQLESGEKIYNYGKNAFPCAEAPGYSVFYKDPASGSIYHTYSTYARGLDMLNGAYHMMDLCPKGRDEQDLSYSMAWLKLHDSYPDEQQQQQEDHAE